MKEKLQALVTSREEEAAKNNDRGPGTATDALYVLRGLRMSCMCGDCYVIFDDQGEVWQWTNFMLQSNEVNTTLHVNFS